MKELIGKLNYGNRGPQGPVGPQGPQGPAGEYIAGDNITIVGDVISAHDTTYTAGENITISEDNVISATGGGSNVNIDNKTIIKDADENICTAVGGYESHDDYITNGVPYLAYIPASKEFRIITDNTYYGTEPYVESTRTYYKPQDDFCDAFCDFIWQWYDESTGILDANVTAQFNGEDNTSDPDYNSDLVVIGANFHFTTFTLDRWTDELYSVGENDNALTLTVYNHSTQTETTYSYRVFCRTTKAQWRSFYIKPSSAADIALPEWQFLIHQFTKFWFYIDPYTYQNAPEINNWTNFIVHQIDSKFVPADASKLDATLCTYQVSEPTADIHDGGVHIVYLQSEPSTKYDGYIYLIAE